MAWPGPASTTEPFPTKYIDPLYQSPSSAAATPGTATPHAKSQQRSAYSITSVIICAIHQMGGDCRGSGREWDGEEQRGLIPGGLKSNHKTNMIIEIQIEKRGSPGECVRRGSAEVRGGEKAWRMKCDLNCACNTQQYTPNEKNGARNASVIRLGGKFDLTACSGKYIHNFLNAASARPALRLRASSSSTGWC